MSEIPKILQVPLKIVPPLTKRKVGHLVEDTIQRKTSREKSHTHTHLNIVTHFYINVNVQKHMSSFLGYSQRSVRKGVPMTVSYLTKNGPESLWDVQLPSSSILQGRY